MRIPVFARHANPRVDTPILRKSITYIQEQIDKGRAHWVDVGNPRKGIVCREMLNFGGRPKDEPESESTHIFAELPGKKVIPAKMQQNPTLPRLHIDPLRIAATRWDWATGAI